jgi:2-keto-3-deoxy-6-phosphogluconate aldolase
VDHRNFQEYLDAGASLAVLGSGLMPPDMVASKDWDAVARHVREALYPSSAKSR